MIRRLTLLCFMVILATAGSLSAQGTTGSLAGTVMHEGAPLPGVTVTITSPALQGTRSSDTNETGTYNFVAHLPGQYSVRVEMSGM